MWTGLMNFLRSLLFFFVAWGTALGSVIGFAFGGVLMHHLGVMIGPFWGVIAGSLLGLVNGLVVLTLGRYARNRQKEVAAAVALVSALGLTGLTLLLVQWSLWMVGLEPYFYPYAPVITFGSGDTALHISYLLPGVLIGSLVLSWLTMLYLNNRYFAWAQRRDTERDTDRSEDASTGTSDSSRVMWWLEQYFERAWLLILLVGLPLIALMNMGYGTTLPGLLLLSGLTVLSGLLMVGLASSVPVILVQRGLLRVYFPTMPAAWRERLLIGLSGSVAALSSLVLMLSVLPDDSTDLLPIYNLASVALALVGLWIAATTTQRYLDWSDANPDEEDANTAVYNQQQDKAKPPRQLTAEGQAALLEDLFDGAHLAEAIDTADRR